MVPLSDAEHARLAGADRVCLTGTGFTGAQRQQARSLAEATGCEYHGDLAFGRTTHLIFKPHAGVRDSNKVRMAQQWGIPVVHWQWLLDSADRGVLLDVRPYQLGCGSSAHLLSSSGQSPAAALHPRKMPAHAAKAASSSPSRPQTAAHSLAAAVGGQLPLPKAQPLDDAHTKQQTAGTGSNEHQHAAGAPATLVQATAQHDVPQRMSDLQRPPALQRHIPFSPGATPAAPPAGQHRHVLSPVASGMQTSPSPLRTPAAAADGIAAAAVTATAAEMEQDDPCRQPGCSEHWRRALGNITNRRRPRGKRHNRQQQPAPTQPQFAERRPGPQMSQHNVRHPVTPAHQQHTRQQAQPSQSRWQGTAPADEQPVSQAPMPEPERRRAASGSPLLQPLSCFQDDMKPGTHVQALPACSFETLSSMTKENSVSDDPGTRPSNEGLLPLRQSDVVSCCAGSRAVPPQHDQLQPPDTPFSIQLPPDAEAVECSASSDLLPGCLPVVTLPRLAPSPATQATQRRPHGALPDQHGTQAVLVEAAVSPARGRVRLWGLQPMNLCSLALRHHQLTDTTAIRFYRYLEVTCEDAAGRQQVFTFDTEDASRAPLLYYDDSSDNNGHPAHTLVYAGLLAAYELHGDAWIEHCYLYDREDIYTDRRGKGPAFLRTHAVSQGELVLSPYVYHSHASAIEGHYQLCHSRAAWLEAGGVGDGKHGHTGGRNCRPERGGSGGDGTAAPSAGGGGVSACPEDAEPGVMASKYCIAGWDRVSGAPWEFDDDQWFRRLWS